MVPPTILLHADDAVAANMQEGEKVSVGVSGKTVLAAVHINGNTPPGLALLRGVAYWPGTAVAEIYQTFYVCVISRGQVVCVISRGQV